MTSLRPVSSAPCQRPPNGHIRIYFNLSVTRSSLALLLYNIQQEKQGQRKMIEIRSIIHRPVIEATKNSLSHDANFKTKKKRDARRWRHSCAVECIRLHPPSIFIFLQKKNDKRSAVYWRPNLNGRRASGVTIQLKQAAHQSPGRAKWLEK